MATNRRALVERMESKPAHQPLNEKTSTLATVIVVVVGTGIVIGLVLLCNALLPRWF